MNKDKFTLVNSLKLRINSIQDEICEGVKIRAKIDDKLKGEQVSAYLLGREKNSKSYLNRINRDNGSVIVNPKAIILYIREYFEKMFIKEKCDEIYQDLFLELIDNIIDRNENDILTSEVTEMEICKALQGMKSGKSPGIDGLTVEFYKTFWEEIKKEFVELVKFIFKSKTISKMNKGIITLTPKEGDPSVITNWRPITMLNVDFKVVAKIITNRLKNVLHLIISREQFCCVGDRSINNMNSIMRDIIFYANENDEAAALINLDWSKAFDRVDHDFLYKILSNFGFDPSFILLIKMLYIDAESILCINGNMSEPFPIKKSVRQGCPLSMILFIIYQEPFYRMMKRKLSNMSLSLPNSLKVSVLGYADDSVIIVTCDESIVECFNVITDYEKASGAILNKNKTTILGIGSWKNKSVWPINGFKLLYGSCKILGVFHSNSYQEGVNLNWVNIENKINRMIGVFVNRKLTIFQKCIIINCKFLAKAWYVSHVYPIPLDSAKRIQRSLFRYLWNRSSEPIKRNTVLLPKLEGGLGMLSILHKSKAILFNTFNKIYVNKCCGFEIMYFYCKIKASFLMESEKNYRDCTIFTTPYYSEIIDTLRKVYCLKNYPTVSVKEVYSVVMDCEDYKPKIESLYPLFNWSQIWKYVNNKYIDKKSREIVYRYIHEILNTNDRLHMMKILNENKCLFCGSIENNMHMFYFCPSLKNILIWLKTILKKFCKIETESLLWILKLNFKTPSKKDENTALVILSDFISGVWYGRSMGLLTDDPNLIVYIRNRMSRTKVILSNAYANILENLFTKEYLLNAIID